MAAVLPVSFALGEIATAARGHGGGDGTGSAPGRRPVRAFLRTNHLGPGRASATGYGAAVVVVAASDSVTSTLYT